MKIAHVVRRYGPVGGMERYVWEVSREQAKLGHEVQVVCEKAYCTAPPGVEIHELGRIAQKPRWISLWRFSRRVEKFFAGIPCDNLVIHSHERLAIHHVTTFHGPPFAGVREKPWFKRISPRIWAQLMLERRELECARIVVPNSPLIAELLTNFYPEIVLATPIPPGVGEIPRRTRHRAPGDGGVVGFVGREWKRKGLPFALAVCDRLMKQRPNLKLLIAGPDAVEVGNEIGGRTYVSSLGWQEDPAIFSGFDLLLHPAIAEPYGMAIAEALAAGVPAVISDRCGIASQLSPEQAEVLALSAPLEDWAAACERQLERENPPPRFSRTWREVAEEYLTLYRSVKC